MAQQAVWVRRGSAGIAGKDSGSPPSIGEPTDVRKRRIAAEIDSRIDHLPPFPTILSELIGLTSSTTSAAEDLRTCIEKDPVLAARLLRLGNSAFYCPRVPVTSVQQAVVMLGHQSVKSLAMAAATLKFLGRGIDAYGISPGGLWMHSYAAAELARDLAQLLTFPEESREAVHVGTLLHDIGKIVLVDLLPSETEAGPHADHGAASGFVEEWERRLTGFTHSVVGQRIAEKWRLAPLTTSCIAFHHRWKEAPEEFVREVALVSLADAGARRLGIGLSESEGNGSEEATAFETLEISEDQFQVTVDEWRDKIGDAQELFSSLGGES